MAAIVQTSQLGLGQLGAIPLGRRLTTGGGLSGLTLFPSALGPARLWTTPDVAGPVSSGNVPSQRAIGAPTVTTETTITPSSLTGPRSIPAGSLVGNIQTITPGTSIPSRQHWTTPTVQGGDQWINLLAGIPSKQRIGSPTVTGGVQGGVGLFLSGVDRSSYLSIAQAMPTVSSQTLGRWNAKFDLFISNGAFVPQVGQSVLLTDANTRLFVGCLTEVITTRELGTTAQLHYGCTAVDLSGICDHRVVVGKTYPQTDSNGDLQDVASTILDIVTNFLNGEGITPGPEIVYGAFGTQSTDYNWNFPTVTNAFDQIASNEGLVWWVDSLSILHFSALANLPAAPFGLTETSLNWRNLMVTSTTTNYYNKLYAVSNLSVIPGSAGGSSGGAVGYTETVIFSATSPNVVFQAGVAVGILTSVGIGSVLSMTVNGAAQSVYDITKYAGQGPTGASDYLWFFGPGDTRLSWTYNPGLTGQTIVINYLPYVSTNASTAQYGQALVPVAGGIPLSTCGSGIYEGVIQVQSVNLAPQLDAIAAAELARVGTLPTVIDFETDYPGLAPGQLMSVNIPLSNAASLTIMLTQITGVMVPGSGPNGSLGHGSNFRWQVEGTTNLDPGNWAKWYENLVRRTNNPLPVLQYEKATFVLAPGSSLSSGNSVTNPYIVQRTGYLTGIAMAASSPPSGQDVILVVTDGIATLWTVTFPATTTPNTLVNIPIDRSVAPYVFSGDVLNINVTYLVTSMLPLPASGLTVSVSWAI